MKYVILDERLKNLPIMPNKGDAGIDLRCCEFATIYLEPGETKLVKSGLKFAIPKGWVGKLYPRSGWGVKKGLILGNTVGIIDSIYRGELLIALKNNGQEDIVIEPMDRVAQMVVTVHLNYERIQQVEELDETERGESGFGDSGIK